MFVQPAEVEVCVPVIADMASGVTMHVQPADLHGDKTRACTEEDCRSR